MPEGDTLHRTAVTLRRVLRGRVLRRFDAPRLVGHGPSPGATILGVEAKGKHLLIHFDDGTTLRTHLKMNGSWHTYRPGERWRKPAWQARAVIETDDAVAVCFSAPVVEIVPSSRLERHPELQHLGPDLCRDDADLDEAVRRMSRLLDPGVEIGVALLDQRVACGVGNVYKSEVLHARGVHPTTRLGALDVREREDLVRTAAELLRANLEGYPRTTVPEGLAVYGRAGQPCRRCGTSISARRQGEHARTTYWCETCQPRRSPHHRRRHRS
jgi:endonuclease VIII